LTDTTEIDDIPKEEGDDSFKRHCEIASALLKLARSGFEPIMVQSIELNALALGSVNEIELAVRSECVSRESARSPSCDEIHPGRFRLEAVEDTTCEILAMFESAPPNECTAAFANLVASVAAHRRGAFRSNRALDSGGSCRRDQGGMGKAQAEASGDLRVGEQLSSHTTGPGHVPGPLSFSKSYFFTRFSFIYHSVARSKRSVSQKQLGVSKTPFIFGETA